MRSSIAASLSLNGSTAFILSVRLMLALPQKKTGGTLSARSSFGVMPVYFWLAIYSWLAIQAFRLGPCSERSSMQSLIWSFALVSARSDAGTLWVVKKLTT